MRAVQVSRFGGPKVLEYVEIERPSPISTGVLVAVHAAGINPVDCKTRRGAGVARWVGPPPFVPGWDVAGVIVAGYGVTRFEPGDEVFGMPWLPRAAGHLHAAALPLAALTGWQSLVDTADLRPGAKRTRPRHRRMPRTPGRADREGARRLGCRHGATREPRFPARSRL